MKKKRKQTKKNNWTKWIPIIIAVTGLLWGISSKLIFDRLDRMEKELMETKLESKLTRQMVSYQQAMLNKIDNQTK